MATPRPPVHLSLIVGGARRPSADVELGRGLIAGDVKALAETWRRFAPMVIVTAERALGSRTEAEDVAQEVFHAVFRKAKSLREPERLRSFIYSFLVRILKYELRTRRLRAWLTFHEPDALTELRQGSMDMESRDILRRCHAMLARLGPRDQLVFILRRMDQMTVEEIAAAMDISISTVKRAITRAVNKLSRWIGNEPELTALLNAWRGQR